MADFNFPLRVQELRQLKVVWGSCWAMGTELYRREIPVPAYEIRFGKAEDRAVIKASAPENLRPACRT